MNKTILCGRLTKDVELRYSAQGMALASFTVAVDRPKKKDGTQETDFITCKAFDKSAEFISKYFIKGSKILLEGRIQTGNYTNKEGQKVYTTDVVVEKAEFCESKGAPATEAKADAGFVQVDESDMDALPFF